jgi:hypothetical protein
MKCSNLVLGRALRTGVESDQPLAGRAVSELGADHLGRCYLHESRGLAHLSEAMAREALGQVHQHCLRPTAQMLT